MSMDNLCDIGYLFVSFMNFEEVMRDLLEEWTVPECLRC